MAAASFTDVVRSLTAKLNPLCRTALVNALGLCVSQTNYEVEIEHWLLKLLEPTDGDLPRILKPLRRQPGPRPARADGRRRKAQARQRPAHAGVLARTGRVDARGLAARLAQLPELPHPLRLPSHRPAQRAEAGAASSAPSSPELAKIPGERLAPRAGRAHRGSSSEAAAEAAGARRFRRPRRRPCRRRRGPSRRPWTSSPSTSPNAPRRATSTRSSAAISRSGKSSTS